MKMFSSKSLRDAARLANSALLLGGLTALSVGCGSDASDPAAVTLDELKAPGNLWIQDNGNGAATLYWTGSNNEKDFDGYNVYGLNVGNDKSKLGSDYKEGQAIELLDEAGEPIPAAKDFLGKFNYNSEKPLEEAKTVTEDGEVKFSALPIHQKGADGEGIFPTCGVDGGVCKNHTASFPVQNVKENSARGTNGSVSYPVSGLKVGQTYCFFVLSSMDEGAKVSMTSTNIACVTPRYKSEFSITIPQSTTHADKLVLDLHTLLDGCKASGCATGVASAVAASTLGRAAKATDPGPVYIEHYQGGAFTIGQYVGVRDLGFYAAGFADPNLPRSAPALKLDEANENPIINIGGYTPAGRSRKIEKNHVYVLAVPEKGTTVKPTNFYYHYMWVKGDVTAGAATAVEMRVSSVLDQR